MPSTKSENKLSMHSAVRFSEKVFGTKPLPGTGEKRQDPDELLMYKQWRMGTFCGWWIKATWNGRTKQDDLIVQIDYTGHYARILGDVEKIPLFTPGKHNFTKQ